MELEEINAEIEKIKSSISKGDSKNPLEEYVYDKGKENTFLDLFEADHDNVDLRSDLTIQEIVIINKLIVDNSFLNEKLGFNLFDEFLEHYLRLKISLDRKSRGEFVDVNRKDRFEQNLQRFNNFSNLAKVKE